MRATGRSRLRPPPRPLVVEPLGPRDAPEAPLLGRERRTWVPRVTHATDRSTVNVQVNTARLSAARAFPHLRTRNVIEGGRGDGRRGRDSRSALPYSGRPRIRSVATPARLRHSPVGHGCGPLLSEDLMEPLAFRVELRLHVLVGGVLGIDVDHLNSTSLTRTVYSADCLHHVLR